MRKSWIAVPAVVALIALAACGDPGPTNPDPGRLKGALRPSMTHVTPDLLLGNATCADIPGATGLTEFKIDPPSSETYMQGPLTVTVTTSDGIYFDWTSNLPVKYVIVKGGPNANLYTYADPGETADQGLHSPDNASGDPAAISHISFCVSDDLITLFGLQVSKTAETRFDRDWDWTINKVGDQSSLTLSPGQTFLVNYQVTVDADKTDSNWEVYGSITIHNSNDGFDDQGNATNEDISINTVTDNVPPNATVSCPQTLPYSLTPGSTLICTYEAAIAEADATTGVNTATVGASVNAVSNNFEAQDPWDFSIADMTETDECIDVTDTYAGSLGTVCATDALPKTFTYSRWVGPYESCGEYTVDNTAAFTTNDTGGTGSSSWSIDVNVPCATCTLTPGYWKTHSIHGPAPSDDAWLALGDVDGDGTAEGADETFFGSGQTYYQVLWTSPQGNAYYILAHAYIAAKLNILNGASTTPAVDAAMTAAASFFGTYNPGSTLTRTQRNAAIANATTLDNYNNGLIGPGHCSE